MDLINGMPYVNFHELNMDWIIKVVKDFLDQYTHLQETITTGETSLQDATTAGLQELNAKATELEALLQQWYTTHQNYLDETLATNTTVFNQRAEEKAAQTIESIPDDYTALADTVEKIQELVESAISMLGYGVQLINPLASDYHNGKMWSATGTLLNNPDTVAFAMPVQAGEAYCANMLGNNSFLYNSGTAPQAISLEHYITFNETTLSYFIVPAGMTNLLVSCAKSALTGPILFKVYNGFIYKPTNFFVDYNDHVLDYATQQKYKGYKYYSFGDSITAYDLLDYIPTTKIAGSWCLGYQHYIVHKTGMTLTNKGISGADSGSILTAVQNTDFSDVYMVTIMTGVNDFGRSISVDIYKNNLTQMVIKILTDNPRCKIFMLSNTYGEFDPQGNIDDRYVTAMREVAEAYGVPFVDNFHNNGFCPNTINTYMADNSQVAYKIHPNNNGMAVMGNQCANAILAKLG